MNNASKIVRQKSVEQFTVEEFISSLKKSGCQIVSVKVDPHNLFYLIVSYNPVEVEVA